MRIANGTDIRTADTLVGQNPLHIKNQQHWQTRTYKTIWCLPSITGKMHIARHARRRDRSAHNAILVCFEPWFIPRRALVSPPIDPLPMSLSYWVHLGTSYYIGLYSL